MNRRRFFSILLTASLASLLLPMLAPAADRTARPNILFLLTDQQQAGMMSCAGNPYVKTPAMDSLARSGARFERAYCSNPVCVPSRVTMMTGVMPSRIGMESNEDMPQSKVTDDIFAHSMGRIFRDAGYETAYGGKVHLPMSLQKIGFDCISKDEREQLADDCSAFLRKKHDKPFLLVASFINPHDICYMAIQAYEKGTGKEVPNVRGRPGAVKPPHEVALDEALKLPAGMSRAEFFKSVCPPLPANVEPPQGEPDTARLVDPRPFRFYVRDRWSDEDWRLHRWAYCRLTERVDGQIGKVLAALRETGLEENTLAVFVSDHGDMDAAHRLEHKSVLYEEATRVPLIVSMKGVTKPGLMVKDHLVSTGLDLIPTLCDFAGIPQPRILAGRSLRALAEGRKADGWRESLVVEGNRSRMVRTAAFKYTVYDSGTPREVLIDLEKDPGEMKNLASDSAYRNVLRQHRELLIDWYRKNGEQLDPKYIVK